MVRQHPGSLRTDKLVGVQAYASLINAHVNRLGHPGGTDIKFVLLFCCLRNHLNFFHFQVGHPAEHGASALNELDFFSSLSKIIPISKTEICLDCMIVLKKNTFLLTDK